MNDETKSERTTIRVVCLGKALSWTDHGGPSKVLHKYALLEDVESDFMKGLMLPGPSCKMFAMGTPLATGSRGSDIPGHVYEGDRSGGTYYDVGAWKWCGSIEDDDLLVAISSDAKIRQKEIDTQRKKKQAKRLDPMIEALRPIQLAYTKTYSMNSGVGRRARQRFIAEIIEFITSGYTA